MKSERIIMCPPGNCLITVITQTQDGMKFLPATTIEQYEGIPPEIPFMKIICARINCANSFLPYQVARAIASQALKCQNIAVGGNK